MIKLDLPKLRICPFEGTPTVTGSVSDLVNADVQRRHSGKPVVFVMMYSCNGSHTQVGSYSCRASVVGASLCAPARFGTLSIATKSPSGGNVFVFFSAAGSGLLTIVSQLMIPTLTELGS